MEVLRVDVQAAACSLNRHGATSREGIAYRQSPSGIVLRLVEDGPDQRM